MTITNSDQQTGEAWTKAMHMACAILDARLQTRSAELTDREVRDEVRRLRDWLAHAGPQDLPALRLLASPAASQRK